MKKISKKHFFIGLAMAMLAAISLWQISSGNSQATKIFRGLASIENEFQPFSLDSVAERDLVRALKLRVLQKLVGKKNSQNIELSLGAFSLHGKNICQKYPQLEVELSAEGVVVSGMIPHILIQVPCRYEEGSEETSAIEIPIEQIKKLQPIDQKIDLAGGGFAEIKGLDDFWPEDWLVAKIKLQGLGAEKSIEIDSYEINFVKGRPLRF